jgi:hypothetical protein
LLNVHSALRRGAKGIATAGPKRTVEFGGLAAQIDADPFRNAERSECGMFPRQQFIRIEAPACNEKKEDSNCGERQVEKSEARKMTEKTEIQIPVVSVEFLAGRPRLEAALADLQIRDL